MYSSESLNSDLYISFHCRYLLDVGEGKVKKPQKDVPDMIETTAEDAEVDNEDVSDMIEIPDYLRSQSRTVDEFCQEIFPNLKKEIAERSPSSWKKWLLSRAIICPTNVEAAEINQKLINQLPGQSWKYYSYDKVYNKTQQHYFPTEWLNRQEKSSMPSHFLELKEGAPIMLIRNLDPKNGHVNGSRYIVMKLSPNVIYAELTTGPKAGERLMIPRILFHPDDPKLPFEFERKQFPVRPCFAMTSNKSQGQTLGHVGICLTNDFFAHGQLYVAMSRVRSPNQLKIFKPLDKDGQPQLCMRNVVYKEILS